MSDTLESTVGDLVVERPSRSRVFSKLGIDFCCGGKKTLRQACREHALEPSTVLSLLEEETSPEPRSTWADAPLSLLVTHIVDRHHVFTRSEVERLRGMLDKVARVHGENHPYMIEVATIFRRFGDEMVAHMAKEERALFPAIVSLESHAPALDLSMPIRVMTAEHETAGADLETMRRLTKDYTPPEGACNTFRAALAGLAELEADLHEHVHLESNVLFPRALKLAD